MDKYTNFPEEKVSTFLMVLFQLHYDHRNIIYIMQICPLLWWDPQASLLYLCYAIDFFAGNFIQMSRSHIEKSQSEAVHTKDVGFNVFNY